MANNFVNWLEEHLISKGWTRAELARRANINQSSLSMIYSGQRNPGKDICESIARTLGEPPEVVFRVAGILPPTFQNDAEWEEWRNELSKLTPEKRATFLRMMRAESEYELQQRQLQEATKRKKTGPLPSI